MKKYSHLLFAVLCLSSCDKLNDFFLPPIPKCEGKALQFDSVDDYVRVDDPFYEFSNEITVEWWANIDPSSGGGSGIGQGDRTR